MLPANLISALQVLSNSGKPLIAAATDAPSKQTPKLDPGQVLQGTVQSQVSEGLFKVQVAGQSLQMRLPGKLQSGDILNLQVVSNSPRLTFSVLASTNPIATPERIGSTARMLSNLADLPIERPVIKQVAGESVWRTTQQAPDTKQIAGALRDALANSGLFYESHQVQWVRGERSTAQLLVEPQNKLQDKNGLVASNPTTSADNTTLPRAASIAQNNLSLNDNLQKLTASPTDTQTAFTKPAENNLAIPKELVHLVQQQLHTLENHQLTWVGQVWPGQEMQWEIQGQPEHKTPQQQDERQWSTEMELALPKLGDVHARLVFSQGTVRLSLQASDSSTVALFNRNLPALSTSLGEQHVPLASASVEKS